jgi:hypothetical protein
MNNCDLEKLEQQREYLNDVLHSDGYDDQFLVLDFECGTGKTRFSECGMGQEYSDGIIKDYTYLFVRERNADAIASAERINQLAGKTIAIAINTDTHTKQEYNKIRKDLKDYKVVVISHEKYKSLSVDTENIKYFSENRDILVIDEFLNITKGNELKINKKWIDDFETKLGSRALRSAFADVVSEIEDYLLKERKLQTFFNAKTPENIISKKISKLKSLVTKNLNKEYLDSIGYSKTSILETIDNIKQFYIQTCVVEGNTMYCTDRRFQYWFLPHNNIMLDASAKLNKAYDISDKFKVNRQSKVLDHSKWKFKIFQTNSCKSAKDKAINFYEKVNNMANAMGLDNTLVIGNKNDEASFNVTYKNHLGNITGSNKYKDLHNCIIAHNPNTPFRTYVLEYIYFSGMRFTNRNSWEGINIGKGDTKVYRFKEDKFEEYRQGKNANEIYQAIKRINRNMEHESKIAIFNNDVDMINTVIKMFKGAEDIKFYENIIEFEKSKQDKYNEERSENRYAMKFIALCQEIMKLKHTDLQAKKKDRKGNDVTLMGIYKKSDLREFMGINSKPNFTIKVLNDVDVIDFLKRHNIVVSGQSLNFNKST